MEEQCDISLESRIQFIQHILYSKLPSHLQKTGHSAKKRLVVTSCKVELLNRSELGFHAASVMFRAEIEFKENSGEEINTGVYSLLVKSIHNLAIVRKMQHSELQFYNEVTLYSNVAPRLLEMCAVSSSNNDVQYYHKMASNLFPKYFYASYEEGIVSMEDLRLLGFKNGGNADMIMDYDHILLAVKNLAVFHALSYGAKRNNLVEFENKVIKAVKDARGFSEIKDYSDKMQCGYLIYLQHTTSLVLEKFTENEYDYAILHDRKLSKLKEAVSDIKNLDKFLKLLLTPEEPLSVLSHGDFNMNNMVFKYDSNNRPADVKFLDFQNIYYCSPVIDLSFLLYMNSSPEVRAQHWDELFNAYHQTLVQAISEFTNSSMEEVSSVYSLEAFQQELSKHCFYGFLIASSFIIGVTSQAGEQDPFKNVNAEALTNDFEEEMKKMCTLEREDVSRRIFSLLKDMLPIMQI